MRGIGYFWELLVQLDVHILNFEILGNMSFLDFGSIIFVENLRCFEVDSFIERLMAKFVREDLSSELWCSL